MTWEQFERDAREVFEYWLMLERRGFIRKYRALQKFGRQISEEYHRDRANRELVRGVKARLQRSGLWDEG